MEATDIYKNDPELKKLNLKLWNRLWRCLDMYSDGKNFKNIQTLFGAKQQSDTKYHKKNDDFNTNIHQTN